jgi:putative membrane protein
MIINFIKGILIGLALVIPGLSGSAFAVVTGLYDKLIFSVNNLRKEFKKSMIFLIPIGLGAAVGILASVNAIIHLMQAFPLQSYAFFTGLVIGSIPAIRGKIKGGGKAKSNYIFAAAGFVIIAAMGFIIPSEEVVAITSIESAGQFIAILTAGIISCVLLAVPGVSGALILILLGQFGTIYNAVGNFAEVLIMLVRGQDGAIELGLSSGAIVFTFLIGAIIGIVAAARIIGYFLERHETKVYFGVMGLMLGAVVTLFNFGVIEHFTEISPYMLLNAVFLIVFAAIGFVCTKFMSGSKS